MRTKNINQPQPFLADQQQFTILWKLASYRLHKLRIWFGKWQSEEQTREVVVQSPVHNSPCTQGELKLTCSWIQRRDHKKEHKVSQSPMSLSLFSMKRGTWTHDLIWARSNWVLSLTSRTVYPSTAMSSFASSGLTKLTSALMAKPLRRIGFNLSGLKLNSNGDVLKLLKNSPRKRIP